MGKYKYMIAGKTYSTKGNAQKRLNAIRDKNPRACPRMRIIGGTKSSRKKLIKRFY
jgi:hypothetical protein